MLSNAETIAVVGVGLGAGCSTAACRPLPVDNDTPVVLDGAAVGADDDAEVGSAVVGVERDVGVVGTGSDVAVVDAVSGGWVVVVGAGVTPVPVGTVGASWRGLEAGAGWVDVVVGIGFVVGEPEASPAVAGSSLVVGVLAEGAVDGDGGVVGEAEEVGEADVVDLGDPAAVPAVSVGVSDDDLPAGSEAACALDDDDWLPPSEAAGAVSARAVPVPAAHAPAIATAPPASFAARTQFRLTLIGVLHHQVGGHPRSPDNNSWNVRPGNACVDERHASPSGDTLEVALLMSTADASTALECNYFVNRYCGYQKTGTHDSRPRGNSHLISLLRCLR